MLLDNFASDFSESARSNHQHDVMFLAFPLGATCQWIILVLVKGGRDDI